MKQINYFQTKMKSVSEKGATLTIEGYASTGDVDRGGDKVLPDAFTETVRDRASKSPIPMLLGHDHEKVIGDWPKMEIDIKGLLVEGEVKFDTDECMAKIKDGALRGLSIGYRVEEWEVEKGGVIIYNSITGLVAGYDVDDMWSNESVRVIKKIDLVEISVVATPMNPFAFINSVKKFFDVEKKDLLASLSKKEGEEESQETPDQPNNQETGDENPAGESPAPSKETSEDAPAGDTTEVVKGDQETEEKPEEKPGETLDETLEDAPKGMTHEEVKSLIDSAVAEAIKSLREAMEQKSASELMTLTDKCTALEEKLAEIDEALSQEVYPERKMFGVGSSRPITYPDLGVPLY